jgi:DNA-binding SARP family transcriptional activator
MRRPTAAARRIWAAARAALALSGTVALWLVHPALPHLSGSLLSPLSTTELEQTVRCIAWLLAACLTLAVLVGAIRSLTHDHGSPAGARLPGVLPSRWTVPDRRSMSKRGRHSPYVLTIPAPLAETHAKPTPSPPSGQPDEAQVAPGQSDPRTISIAVLGPLAIDGLAHKIKRAATYELLAYLAFHPQGASRDELTEAIWPEQDPARTRPRLWQSVTEAKRALGKAWLHHGERYQLDRAKVRVDLDDLDRLLTASGDDTTDPAALETALALWRGEPLEGSDYLWSEGEIRNLHATLVDLLERVGRSRLGRGDARGALQLAEQAITLDGLHEPSWRLALQAEYSLGLRESIARRYDELARSLDEQLGLEPARETRLIYRQLLGQN